MITKLLHADESYKIRGACFRVYNEFGSIREKIIERALNEELQAQGLKVETQASIDLYYRGKKIGKYIPDMVVEDKIIIEIKSKPYLTKEDMKQFWGYLKQSKYDLGFLVIFTPQKLIIKRYICNIR
jgi:GxxExxY protein